MTACEHKPGQMRPVEGAAEGSRTLTIVGMRCACGKTFEIKPCARRGCAGMAIVTGPLAIYCTPTCAGWVPKKKRRRKPRAA